MHLVTQSAFLKALGWSLFNSLWQMALLWLLYTLLTAVFKKASANMRHGLAVLLLGVGASWFAGSFIINFSLVENNPAASPWPGGILLTGEHPGYVFREASRQFINQLLPYCSFLYLLVLVFLFIRYSNHYFHSRQLKLTGLSKIQPELRVFVTETSRSMGIEKKVRVWLSSLVEGPVTLGFLKPVILIPFATINNLTLQQVEALLLHELAHIKRYDYLLNLGVTILEILFFFNPFSRLLIQNIKKEREHRCDDLVMQFRYDPHTYVSALLSLATAGQRRQSMVLAATGKNDQLLLQRVKRILKQKRSVDRPGARSLVFLLFAVFTAAVTFSRPGNPVARLIQRNGAGALRNPVAMSAQEIAPVHFLPKDKGLTPIRPLAGHRKNKPVYAPSPDDDRMLPDGIVLAGNKEPSTDDDADHEDVLAEGLTATIQPEKREYSIGQPEPVLSISSSGPNQDLPFVPNSSFSYRYTEDTAYSNRSLAYWENVVREEIRKARRVLAAEQSTICRLQKELAQVQLRAIRVNLSKKQPEIQKLQRQLREERSRLNREYLQELSRELEKAGRKLIIVYI